MSSDLSLDTSSGDITCEQDPELASAVRPLYNAALHKRTRGDLRRLLQRMFDANAELYCTNSECGGHYFVPAKHLAFIAKVDAAATAFGFVYAHPYQDGNGRLHRCLIHHVLAEREFVL